MIKTLCSLVISFTKIGLISLGGGNSMLKLLEYESVDYRHWIGKEEFVAMLGSSFLFPGLTAFKLSGLIGYKVAGLLGLCIAVLCLNLPGLILATVSYQWLNTHNGPIVRKIMVAVQYGGLALLAAATVSVAQGVIGVQFSLPIALSCIIFFLALVFGNLSPFYGFLLFIAVSFWLVR